MQIHAKCEILFMRNEDCARRYYCNIEWPLRAHWLRVNAFSSPCYEHKYHAKAAARQFAKKNNLAIVEWVDKT